MTVYRYNIIQHQKSQKQHKNSQVNVQHKYLQDTKLYENIQNQTNEDATVEKVVDQIQTQKAIRETILEQIIEKVQSKTSEYENEITETITEKNMSKTQDRCKCKNAS